MVAALWSGHEDLALRMVRLLTAEPRPKRLRLSSFDVELLVTNAAAARKRVGPVSLRVPFQFVIVRSRPCLTLLSSSHFGWSWLVFFTQSGFVRCRELRMCAGSEAVLAALLDFCLCNYLLPLVRQFGLRFGCIVCGTES